MIYTVTLNPSLDYNVFVNDLKMGKTNRSQRESVFAGGKGINVSIYLDRCGLPTKALGILAGFTGREIQRLITESGIDNDMIFAQSGMSRINVKIKSTDETEINGSGPSVTDGELEAFFKLIDRIGNGDFLILSGSVPPALPKDIYASIIKRLSAKDVKVAADTSGEQLRNVLPCSPFLIKPNEAELEEITGIKTASFDDAFKGAEKLQSMGAGNVIVSLGEKGAVLLWQDGRKYVCEAAKGTAINTVGSGDCLLAGFIAEYMRSGDEEAALRSGVTAGCACAFAEGLPGEEDARKLLTGLRAYQL